MISSKSKRIYFFVNDIQLIVMSDNKRQPILTFEQLETEHYQTFSRPKLISHESTTLFSF